MFNKKNCKKCGKKLKSEYDFCPSCGSVIKASKKEWGMLGKDDYLEQENGFQSPNMLGGISGGFLNKMVGSAMKMLEKELAKEMKGIENQRVPKTRMKLMINGKEINLDSNDLKRLQQGETIKAKPKDSKNPTKKLPINFSDKKLKEFQKLKKVEPKSEMRRLGDIVTYEIFVPGVESLEDISIINLEKGMEIKAIAKTKAYLKMIPIKLALTKYLLSKGKLTLEMDAKI